MTKKVRFITIVALGISTLTGTAATAVLATNAPAAVVSSADGAPAGEPAAQPASTATPVPVPSPTDPQKTWGWG
ncbi:hypothetical protein ACFVHB_11020 [Kitasatospora sp. NPDC127111]|uniref:hypothetical protein n=1 Tax=Kitasatospora sp. NPDC127111 TaxID=3345363 RepID=UPI00363900D5